MTAPERPALFTRIRDFLRRTPPPVPNADTRSWTALDAPTDELPSVGAPRSPSTEPERSVDPNRELWARADALEAALFDAMTWENTPAEYAGWDDADPDLTVADVRGGRPSTDIEQELLGLVEENPSVFVGTRFEPVPSESPHELDFEDVGDPDAQDARIDQLATSITRTRAALILADDEYADELDNDMEVDDLETVLAAERAVELNGWDRAATLALGHRERERRDIINGGPLLTGAERNIDRARLTEITSANTFAVLDSAAPGGVRELTDADRATLESFDGYIAGRVVRGDGQIVGDHYVAELRRLGLDPEGHADHDLTDQRFADPVTTARADQFSERSQGLGEASTWIAGRHTNDGADLSDGLGDVVGRVSRALGAGRFGGQAAVENPEGRGTEQTAPRGAPSPGPISDPARRGPQR